MKEENLKYLNRAESLRYMGYKGEPEGAFLSALEKCESDVADAAEPRYVCRLADVSQLKDFLTGRDVARHISGCQRVILFAATLGGAVDDLIRRYEIESMASALAADAVSSAFIEEYCKELDTFLAEKFEPLCLTWRFSPGYGDFPIEAQKELVRMTDAFKKIGLGVNSSFMLSPSKSVTAVIGVSEDEIPKERVSCAVCSAAQRCRFRKEGLHCGF